MASSQRQNNKKKKSFFKCIFYYMKVLDFSVVFQPKAVSHAWTQVAIKTCKLIDAIALGSTQSSKLPRSG